MFRHMSVAGLTMAMLLLIAISTSQDANAWAKGQPTDWNQVDLYPCYDYPQFFQQHGSYEQTHYRCDPGMPIPCSPYKPYHTGYTFILDTF